MCKESNASRASLSDLKMGRKQNLSSETLSKIASYFDVSVDYLLGSGQKETPAANSGEREIAFDDFTYAMFEEGKELSPENKKKLLEMAQFFKQQQDKEKGI